jgi:hypothetical protein
MIARCGECVCLNAQPGNETCAPHGRRSPDQTPCANGFAFSMDQLRASLYGAKAKAPRSPEPQRDLFG